MAGRKYNKYHSTIDLAHTVNIIPAMEKFEELMGEEGAITIDIAKRHLNCEGPYAPNTNRYFLNGVVIEQRPYSLGKLETNLISSVGTPLTPTLKLLREKFDHRF